MRAEILIADDDEIARDIMAHVLSDRGHAVMLAPDGARALEVLRRRAFDVAVLDYHMPLLDGATTVRRIVEDTLRPAYTRFIGVTADPDGLESRDRSGIMFDAIVQKPLSLPAFVETVETCLSDLRRAKREEDILSAWRASGFERRPRARFAVDPGLDGMARLGLVFDLTRPGNPDVILLTEDAHPNELAELRIEGNLFTLPMVDVAGRWGALADAQFDIDDRAGWADVAATAKLFASRRTLLTRRFLSAATLPEKLLAYIFVSGRDLSPSSFDADEWTPTYPGFFPVRRVRDTAERLVHEGLLSRRAMDREDPAGSSSTLPCFTLTAAALAGLTGNDLEDAFPRRSIRWPPPLEQAR